MKKLLLTLLLALPIAGFSAGGTDWPMEDFEGDLHNLPSLQNGFALYANYCMGCHGLQYTLIQHYHAKRNKVGLEIFHVDLYRISCHSEIEELGLEDALGIGVSLIEWPELSIPSLPQDRLEIYLQFGKGVSERYMDLFGSSRWLSLAHSIEG